MVKFEVVSKYAHSDIDLIPKRSTAHSAGYDMVAAEDTIIPAHMGLISMLDDAQPSRYLNKALTLDEMSALTKRLKVKPTLVSTGVKAYLDKNQYLQIVSRSSFPLKYWLICANSIGVIDADYADNPDNEGEIFFQVINLSPYPIKICRGEKICQGIIQSYITTDTDNSAGARVGGLGSTGK